MAIDPDEQFRGAKDETNTAERFWIGVAAIRMAYLHFDVVSARKGDLLTVFKSQYKERGGAALVHDGDGGATSRWVIACNYLEVAASMGLSSAQFYLAELLRQKRVQHIGAQHSAELRALRLYMRAANSGFAEAQVRRCHFFVITHTTIYIYIILGKDSFPSHLYVCTSYFLLIIRHDLHGISTTASRY